MAETHTQTHTHATHTHTHIERERERERERAGEDVPLAVDCNPRKVGVGATWRGAGPKARLTFFSVQQPAVTTPC